MSRLSLNHITLNRLSIAEALDACRRAGIDSIGLWREKVAEAGLPEAARLVEASGMRVSSLCRGGFFTSANAGVENRRVVDEANALGADLVVLVCGGLPSGSRDLDGARAAVVNGLDELVPYAASCGVRLGIEPLHPMFCADRSVVCTLRQALELAEPYPAENVGVIVDAYHVWWDPHLDEALSLASGRIFGFHIDDWGLPLPAGALLGRRLPGDGCIDLAALARAVFAAGFDGVVEVEILNEAVWNAPADAVVDAIRSYAEPLLAQARAVVP